MKSVPVAIILRMVFNKKPLQESKLLYKDISYKLSAFDVTKADFAKIARADGHATVNLGPVQEGNQTFELNAKSISMLELKDIIKENPYVAVLSKAKGVTTDTGSKRYVGLLAIAFDDIDDFNSLKKPALKLAETNKDVRDSQRTKLYKWEGTFFDRAKRLDKGWAATSLKQLRTIAKKVLLHFNIAEDKVHINTQPTKSESRLGVTRTFRDDATSESPLYNIVNIHDATIDTLLHELAHVITWHRYKRGEASGHGAEFCGVYANILGLFSIFDEDQVITSMEKAGLKVKLFNKTTKDVGEL